MKDYTDTVTLLSIVKCCIECIQDRIILDQSTTEFLKLAILDYLKGASSQIAYGMLFNIVRGGAMRPMIIGARVLKRMEEALEISMTDRYSYLIKSVDI